MPRTSTARSADGRLRCDERRRVLVGEVVGEAQLDPLPPVPAADPDVGDPERGRPGQGIPSVGLIVGTAAAAREAATDHEHDPLRLDALGTQGPVHAFALDGERDRLACRRLQAQVLLELRSPHRAVERQGAQDVVARRPDMRGRRLVQPEDGAREGQPRTRLEIHRATPRVREGRTEADPEGGEGREARQPVGSGGGTA